MTQKKRKKQRRKKTRPQKAPIIKVPVEDTKKDITPPAKKRIKPLYVFIPALFVIAGVLVYFFVFLPKNLASHALKIEKNNDLNVLFIIIDTLRADRVGYSGYAIETPNMDFLAKEGTRFMNTSCQYPMTLPSHVSIMTSTFPQYHGIKNNGYYFLEERYITLAEILKGKGFVTSAFIGAVVLESKFGLAQGFDTYDDTFKTPESLNALEAQNLAEDVYLSARRWFEKNYQKKFFMWVHFYDPHAPYTPPSPYNTRYSNPYDGEVAYTDVYVGSLIEMLKEKKLLNKTLIVFTSDHGEGLEEHDEVTHGVFLYDTTIQVPLVFCCPGVLPQDRSVDKQVRTVDIMPTLLDILDVELPEALQGRSLVPLIEKESSPGFDSYAETYFPLLSNGWSPLKSIRTQKYKYIEAPKAELYDLVQDPLESQNIINKNPGVARDMAERLKRFEEEYAAISEPGQKTLSFEEREKLRSLGYIEFIEEGSLSASALPDPKEKIQVFNQIQKAYDFFWKGRLDKAEEIVSDILPFNPNNPGLNYLSARIHFTNQRFEEALKESKNVLQANSKHTDALLLMGLCYLNLNQPDEAISVLAQIPRIVPQDTESLSLISMAYREKNDFEKSLEYIDKAIDIDSENLKLRLQLAETLDLMKESEKAFIEYENILERAPQNPRAHSSLGIFYMNRGKFSKGIEHLEASAQLFPSPDIYYYLGFAYKSVGRNSKAIESFRKFLELAPPFERERKKMVQEALSSLER
jgi:arylsulfatase A-like enzyme/thioredoxin-like negative regulator of GroEL